jgi:hypothetical protein
METNALPAAYLFAAVTEAASEDVMSSLSNLLPYRIKTGERPMPPLPAARRTDPRKTLETPTPERVRTLEVRWDLDAERLKSDEFRVDPCLDVAMRILEVIPYDRFELESETDEVLRYRLRDPDWKLVSVIFMKKSLRRLAADPHRDVKLRYLQNDLAWSTRQRQIFTYPHALRHHLLEG